MKREDCLDDSGLFTADKAAATESMSELLGTSLKLSARGSLIVSGSL